MKFICAWCKKEVKEETDDKPTQTSHVICESCKKETEQKLKGE